MQDAIKQLFVTLGMGLFCLFQSYAEIMSKAERGNMRSIHEYLADLSKNIDKSEENFYAEFAKHEDSALAESPGFLFGKTVFKEIGRRKKIYTNSTYGLDILYNCYELVVRNRYLFYHLQFLIIYM